MTTLAEWLVKIEAMHPETIKLGLERMAEVASRLGITRLPGKVITVGGTNGKGSTLRLLDQLARSTGLSTSVYTSPHLYRFTERVCQNGQEADAEAFAQAFDRVDKARQGVSLTYFEFTTLAAFCLFEQKPTDLYLLEVGLGGRLDAVNLLDADVSVITSVGLDHTDWLGDTREAIGREKAGIARANRPLIYGEADMPVTVAEVAEQVGATLIRQGDTFGVKKNQLFWATHKVELLQPAVLGNDNLATALMALECLGIVPEMHLINQVAAHTHLMGRCEKHVINNHDWFFDVGHNREAVARFASLLSPHSGKTHALVAMLNDKPADAMLALKPNVDHWFVANLPGPRGGGVERFAQLLPQAQLFDRLEEGLAAVQQALQPNDRVIVTGSFVTVTEVQKLLGLNQLADEDSL